jgi:hypothetical protein
MTNEHDAVVLLILFFWFPFVQPHCKHRMLFRNSVQYCLCNISSFNHGTLEAWGAQSVQDIYRKPTHDPGGHRSGQLTTCTLTLFPRLYPHGGNPWHGHGIIVETVEEKPCPCSDKLLGVLGPLYVLEFRSHTSSLSSPCGNDGLVCVVIIS